MAIWNFNVTHKNQTTTTGSKNVNPPGVGQAVTIPAVPCLCGYNHTLIGTQSSANVMSGSGSNSVAPPNDPNAPGSPKDEDIPSWQGGPGNPAEDEDEGDGEDETDGEDQPNGESEPEDEGESR